MFSRENKKDEYCLFSFFAKVEEEEELEEAIELPVLEFQKTCFRGRDELRWPI